MTLTAEQLQRATQAKSDQLNSCDLLGGPLVAKIVDVKSGSADQPVIIVIDSWSQPWKPSKTSLRVLCACWGGDPQQWIGRYAVLYNDESVTWGGEAIGGIRASHLSHIEGRKSISVNAKKGKKAAQIVEPYYPEDQPAPAATPVFWPDDAFEKQYAKAEPKLMAGESQAEDVIAALEKKAPLTEGQKARLRRCKPVESEPVIEDEPPQLEDGDPFSMNDQE
jgi:hypothetical protein